MNDSIISFPQGLWAPEDAPWDAIGRWFTGDLLGGPRGNLADTLQRYARFINSIQLNEPDAIYINFDADEYKGSKMVQFIVALTDHRPDEMHIVRLDPLKKVGSQVTLRLWWD
jgi:hypothetical protein